MSHADHEWAKEHLPAHLAGGLSAEERARLEAPLSGCAECIAEIDALRRFDRGMEELFAPVRPKPGLEERVIRGLRAAPTGWAPSAAARVGLAVAAVLLLGIVGVVILSVEGGVMQSRPEMLRGPVRPPTFALEDAEGASAKSQSADEMARDAARRQLAQLQAVERKLVESDHRETADDADEFKKSKGDSLDDVYDKRFVGGLKGTELSKARAAPPAPSRPAAPGIHAARDAGAGRFEPETDKFYSYRSDAPSSGKDGKPAGPQAGYFKPGELAAANRLAERSEVDEKQAAADPGKLAQEKNSPKQAPPEEQTQRKIIRTGEMEFEVENFDSAVATVTKIAGEEKGFIGTVNSEKLPNGKVRGTVVVRCPPENLDRLLLQLRALGELKSQRIASQDVTKMYTDIEGRLRAARTMEERLIQIIKEGKGQIKDLLAAEKELGEWRTKIEVLEGEIRYYNNMISLSTLTITLYEKEIRSPFGVIETERVQMGVEVEDVEKAHKDALAAVADAKGRVTRSELKQHGPGQLSAIVNCEVPPDAAGPLRDRLKQLGTVARLDVQRDQQTEGGSGKPAELKVKKNDAVFSVSLYNLTNVAPRETVHLNLASADAEKSYKDILARVEKAGGRVITSSLQQPKKDQTTGTVRFEVKSADAESVINDLKTYGEVMRLQRTENADTQNVTRSKQGFECQVYALGMVAPRETTTIQLACKDVPAAYQEILAAVRKAEGRILSAGLNEQDRHNVTGTIDFEVRRELKKAVDDAMAASGPVFSRNASQAQDLENVVDSKTRLQLTLLNIERIPPRETHTLALEVGNVERRVGEIAALAAEVKGRVTGPFLSKDSSGRMVGRITLDVPLAAALSSVQRVKDLASEVRMIESSRNPSVPESDLSVARIDVTLSNEVILPTDSSPWANIRKGLSVSLTALSWSLTLIVIGLCFALPLGLAGWGGWKVYQKVRAKAA